MADKATLYHYDTSFMGLAARAENSARIIVHLLHDALPISSVADFGCALGTWLAKWRHFGVEDVIGVDGPYVRSEDLQIPRQLFRAHDLARSIDLGRCFDLVESMEVAEHLPETAAGGFVANLARHADIVLFSAATPGQGGENHLNEQPYEYWRALFARHGYRVFDWLRPQIAECKDVQFWYRYNLLLFIAADRVATLPPQVRASEVEPALPIPDFAPWRFRMRKELIRRVPPGVQNGISRTLLRLRGL